MAIGILVNGAGGRMGQTALAAIAADADLFVAAQTGRGDDLAAAIGRSGCDAVLDFAGAEAVFDRARAIIAAGARPVIGSSGLLADQVGQLRRLCAQKRLGGLVAPNFSLSAVLMMRYARDAARHLRRAEIVEWHHDRKADAPSGTAIRTAELIAGSIDAAAPATQAILPGARGARHGNVPIHSVRLPGLVAHQEVLLGGLGQTLSIRSDTISREAFVPGILLACKRVVELDQLHYGLEHLL